MSLQPSIDLLAVKIKYGDILTPLEMKEIHQLLLTIRLLPNHLSDEKIQSIAFGAAHELADIYTATTGDYKRHNAAVIAAAIRSALK